MRKILAYAGTDAENLVGGGLYFGLAWLVSELRVNVSDDSIGVVGDIFVAARTGHPEEFSERLTERDVMAGAQKVVLSLIVQAVVEEKVLEWDYSWGWPADVNSFHDRASNDNELGVGWMNRERENAIAVVVAIFECGRSRVRL